MQGPLASFVTMSVHGIVTFKLPFGTRNITPGNVVCYDIIVKEKRIYS
jgi:hypothetical protein